MSLYRRSNTPYWWTRFTIAGREIRISSGTTSRQQAEEFESAERAKRWRTIRLGEKPLYSWLDAKRRWLEETRKRSKSTDENLFIFLDEHLSDMPVQAVTREVIDRLRKVRLAEGVSEATVNRLMCLLRALLRKCEHDWQVIDRAPPVPMYRTQAQEPRWVTREEFKRLVAALPPHLAVAARFAVLTGLRMRSMLSLEWQNVDLIARRAWLPAEKMKGGVTFGFPLSDAAVLVLRDAKALQEQQERDHRQWCETHDKGYAPLEMPSVFTYRRKPIDDCNTVAFQYSVKAAGVAPLRWHDLRHTFASWALQSGVTPYELMQLGSWKSLRMVERYAHLSPDHLAEAAQKIAGAPHTKGHSKGKRAVRIGRDT